MPDNISDALEAAERARTTGDYALALRALDDALTEGATFSETLVAFVRLKAVCLVKLTQWSDLVPFCSQFIGPLRKYGVYHALCEFHGYLGTALLRLGRYAESEVHFRAAMHVAIWDVGDDSLALWHQRQLALMYKNLGLWHQAAHECRAALATAERKHVTDQLGVLRKNLAIILLKSGPVSDVQQLLDRADSEVAATGKRHWSIRARLVRARYLRMIGEHQDGLDVLSAILPTTREGEYSREEAICLEYMGDCLLAEGRHKEALEHYEAAQKIAEVTAPQGDLIPELGHR
ncbi:MAG TPA: hypothetical protein VF363_10825, partial [Candidatus Eisenbacteria bacterium]